jgi:hypothetical protein
MNPEQTAVVVKKSILGIPGCTIAHELGVHPSTVTRTQQRPEIKAKIERAGEYIVNRGLQPAVKTICRLAAMGNQDRRDPETGLKLFDKEVAKLSLDASKHITSMAGLSGTAPSTIINAMIQINQAPEQQQELNGLAAFLGSQWQQPIDITQDATECTHTIA